MPRRSRPTSNYPLDSELLYDGIRVVTRWLGRLREWEGIGFVDHTRRAKRRSLNIRNRRGKKRADAYRDLIKWRPRRPTMESRRWQLPHSGAIPSSLAGAEQLPTI